MRQQPVPAMAGRELAMLRRGRTLWQMGGQLPANQLQGDQLRRSSADVGFWRGPRRCPCAASSPTAPAGPSSSTSWPRGRTRRIRSTSARQEALNRIREATGGRLDIKLFPANQLGSDTDLLSQVRNGSVEFFNLSTSILSTFVPVAGHRSTPASPSRITTQCGRRWTATSAPMFARRSPRRRS